MPTRPSVIDFHTHYLPAGFAIGAISQGSAQNRARWEAIARRISDRQALLEDIEAGDLAGRVVNSPTALLETDAGRLPDGIHERLNEELAELVSANPGKLYGLASVDTFGGETAARRLEHAIRHLGLQGVFVDSAKGELLEDGQRHAFRITQIEDIDQMVWNAATIGHRRFRNADIHSPVEIARVRVDDLTIESAT